MDWKKVYSTDEKYCNDKNIPIRYCEFCNKRITYKGMTDGKQVYWVIPLSCDCEEALLKQLEDIKDKELEEVNKRYMVIKKNISQSGIKRCRIKYNYFFPRNKDQEKYKEAIKYYIDNLETLNGKKGFYIYGDIGTGKTYIATMIGNEFLDKGYQVYFITNSEIKNELNPFNNSSPKDFKRKCKHCKLLIIDDLGIEKATENYISGLYDIINYRYANNKPLIVTTNLDLDQLASKLQYSKDGLEGSQIVDRLKEMCSGMAICGKSLRK